MMSPCRRGTGRLAVREGYNDVRCATAAEFAPPMSRPLAVSMVAFDGYPAELALEEIARAGASHAEPAFIAGTMRFAEDDLSEPAAAALGRAIDAAGLLCVAVSVHMDNGADDAGERLARRLRFAAALGAGLAITNAARQTQRDGFMRTMAEALPEAERCGVALAFENPGHGADDLLRGAADAGPLLAHIGSPWAVLNYDVGNTLTNSEGATRPEDDLPLALPLARHLHLKDVSRDDRAWRYTALGGGELDYATMLNRLAAWPELPVCIELPLRQVRPRHRAPERAAEPPPLATVREAVGASVRRVRQALPA